MRYSIDKIAAIIGAQRYGTREASVSFLLTDSRSLCFPEETLFFALKTERNDGHLYVAELYRRGVRNFVVNRRPSEVFDDANFLVVTDTLKALQQLAASHRAAFDVPVVDSGDVYARVVVRALECYESIKIIRQALENLPEGPINLGTKLPKIKEGMAVTRHEAPRGQLTYMVIGDGGFNNYRVSAHVPSYKNTPTVPHMLRGNTVADAGLIIASIDPCFSCLDR